jgi:uncharacterized protein YcaQ
MPTSAAVARLRTHAISTSLAAPAPLAATVERLGFVQADPIRAPARAQDLILRQRVPGYVAGDLERAYPMLDLEEEYLYAYGFLLRPYAELVHPRPARRLSSLERRILALSAEHGPLHPRDLDEHVGRARVVNAWGGQSAAATRALDRLQYDGRLRVVRREGGIRVYEAVAPRMPARSAPERFTDIVMLLADIHEPVSERTLFALTFEFRRWRGVDHHAIVRNLVAAGRLQAETIDGVRYLWPAASRPNDLPERTVRFLAPFDPIVWDRARFEHLWGWPYRFEAYVPKAKRVRGYYALPLLWGNDVVGWANARVVDDALDVEVGYAGTRPRDRGFTRELDAEIQRLEAFLRLGLVVEGPGA